MTNNTHQIQLTLFFTKNTSTQQKKITVKILTTIIVINNDISFFVAKIPPRRSHCMTIPKSKIIHTRTKNYDDDLIDFFVVLSRKHSSARRVKIMVDNLSVMIE